VFFFSSRRRHTRFSRDWSSDVCSSDLATELDRQDRVARGREGFGTGLRQPGDDLGLFGGFAFHQQLRINPQRRGNTVHPGERERSEERRVGKECRSRWWAEHEKKKTQQ